MADLEDLKKIVREKVLITDYKQNTHDDFAANAWIFDFRNVLLTPKYLNLITELLYTHIANTYDRFQIGGMESAAIPLVTSLILHAEKQGKTVNGFYVRKSRKKSGLYKEIEGIVTDDPIILVDDLMNSGSSFKKQILALESIHKKVDAVLTVVRFRTKDYYKFLIEGEIAIHNLFTLADFDLSLGNDPLASADTSDYVPLWTFSPEFSTHRLVNPRSTPVVYKNSLLFGADDGYFRSLDKRTGAEQWKFRVGRSEQGKSILSSPVVYGDRVYFGAYDGRLYVCNVTDGTPVWVFDESDWVGSSPAMCEKLNSLFIGLEHAEPEYRGSVVALDLQTGKRKWEYRVRALVHATPLVLSQYAQVAVGGNEGMLYLFDAKTGELEWRFETEGGRRYVGSGGFSPGDIKMAPVYDADTDTLAFSSMDGYVYVLERKTGTLRYRCLTESNEPDVKIGIYNSPLFADSYLVFGGLDKIVYCYHKKTGELHWRYKTNGRIFSSPVVRNGIVYIGSNDGALYEIELSTGRLVGKRQFAKRIVNQIVFDETDGKTTAYLTMNGSYICAVQLP